MIEIIFTIPPSLLIIQPTTPLMRYMRHGHRREWLEATLTLIADGKLPNTVKLLDQRRKHMINLTGVSRHTVCTHVWHIF